MMSNPSESAPSRQSLKGYSSNVSLTLRRGDLTVAVAQAGDGELVFDKPLTLTPGECTLIRSVDGDERMWQIEVLGNGDVTENASFRFL